MGAKAKDVGGGPAVPLANDWTQFMRQGLNTGTFGQGRQQTPADGMMRTDPVGQTQGIGGYINNALSGNLGAKQYTPDVSGLQNVVGQGKFDFGQFNPSTVDFSKFQNPLQGFNASAQTIGQAPGIAGNQQFQGMLGSLQNIGNMSPEQLARISSSVTGGGIGGPAPNVSMGDVDVSQYQGLLDRRRSMGLADQRARFGAAGGAAFGTPAAFAESNFLNENAATDAAAMADIGRAQQGLKLQEGQINSGNYNAWQNNLANMAGINSSLFGNLYGNNISALSSGLGHLGGALSQDASNYLDASKANASNNLAAQGLNADALYRMGGLDLDAMKAMSQQGVDIQGLLNQRQGMQAQNQLGAAGMDADILANILGFQGDAAKFGEGQRQFDVGVGGDVLGRLMQQYGALADKGISQRQTVMQPSGFQNAISGIAGISGAVAPFMTGGFNPISALGGLFGGGTTNPVMTGGQRPGGAEGGLVTEDGIYPSINHFAAGGLVGGMPNFLQNLPKPQGGSAGGFANVAKNVFGGGGGGLRQTIGNVFNQQRPAGPSPMPMNRGIGGLNFGGAPNPNVNPIGNMGGPMIGAGAPGGLRQMNQPMVNMMGGNPLSTLRNAGGMFGGNPLAGMQGGMFGARTPAQPFNLSQLHSGLTGGASINPFGGMGGRLGFAEGGEVPPMSSDTVPAMLTPGENVITKHVSDLLGPFAQMLNDLKTPEQIKKVRKAIGDAMGAGLDESFVASMQEGGM